MCWNRVIQLVLHLTFRSLQQEICLQPPRIVSEHFINLFAWTCIRIVSLSTMLLHVRILKFKSSIELMASYLFFVRNNINSSFHKGLLFSCWALYGVGSVLMACLAFFFCFAFSFLWCKFTFSVLYSRNNLLSSIPADIGTLSKLGILDLHSNQVLPIFYITKLSFF